MQWRNTWTGYGAIAKFLHGSIVILIIAQYVIIEATEEWRKSVFAVLTTVAVLHALAALYHHFWRRDDALRRMLPFVAPRAWQNRR